MRVSPKLNRWLTGPQSDPSVRVRFWTEVEGRSPDDPKVRRARHEIGRTGWAARLLSNQFPDGHWVTSRATAEDLYVPKYIVTNWRVIVLADLGATRSDPRIRRAAQLVLDRWTKPGWALAGRAGEICITGNAVRTLVRFGYLDHPAVQRSIDWIVRAQKKDGGWHCFPSRTGTLDGWEGLAAFAEIPPSDRSDAVRRSIERGAEFYLERHLMDEGTESYPPWSRIHYPNHYYYDVLVGLRILTRLGYGRDPRLRRAVRWLKERRREDGTWWIDAIHPDIDPRLEGYWPRTPIYPMVLELPGAPSRWATVEALSVLARTGDA